MRKTGTIENVEGDMDDTIIQCKYDILDGSGRSVAMTLSGWSVDVITDDENDENYVTLIFKEFKKKSNDETYVTQRVQELIKELTKHEATQENNKFVMKMSLESFKTLRNEKQQFRRMSQTVIRKGEPISTEDFLQIHAENSSSLDRTYVQYW